MDSTIDQQDAYDQHVTAQFQCYNRIFVTLPFGDLLQAGEQLRLLQERCRTGLSSNQTPQEIIDNFLTQEVQVTSFEQQMDVLFLVLQFIERQIVLFDAVEDSAFTQLHDVNGEGTLVRLLQKVTDNNLTAQLQNKLQHFTTRVVLTAHPTQFYPVNVLMIIEDLIKAINEKDDAKVRRLLLQLGKTPLQNLRAPSPLDEAKLLIYQLENVFYPAIINIHQQLPLNNIPIIELGFWPGGDRDGNPFVTAETTLQVAALLKQRLLDLYIEEIQYLQRRLTFKGVSEKLCIIKSRLQHANNAYQNVQELIEDLNNLLVVINRHHQGLFAEKLEKMLVAVKSFGFHFATLDLRQDSRIHSQSLIGLYEKWLKTKSLTANEKELLSSYKMANVEQRAAILQKLLALSPPDLPDDLDDVLQSLHAAWRIQSLNGEAGLHRYIISNTQSAADVLVVLLLAAWSKGSLNTVTLDIVPLFETIDDLRNAPGIMRHLWTLPVYREHLQRRQLVQTIMLGFSDGTKDGGYVSANWGIVQAKLVLSKIAQEQGITLLFFDGRGGPPARGGGYSHQFYRAIEGAIDQHQIQLTLQGQTITTDYGTVQSAQYNLEQLCTAGLESALFPSIENTIRPIDQTILQELSGYSEQSYQRLKNHPQFLSYLETMTPLQYYGELNIASRPPSRPGSGPMQFEDLRAISFVGAWSQMKQNVPGFYGFGYACEQYIAQHGIEPLQNLYQRSLFFQTLIANAMQSLKKSLFALTQYIRKDKKYGDFWQLLQNEADLTVRVLREIAQQTVLLEDDPFTRQSIQLREDIVLPLQVIQQYALQQLQNDSIQNDQKDIYKKLILKAIATNINAARNAV